MKDELARAYFYKGEMYRLAGDMAKALFYEKESELIFKNCDLNKRRNLDIYQQLCEALAYINIIFDEDKLSLHYCKLSLQSAQKLGDKRYQVFTLGMASSCCNVPSAAEYKREYPFSFNARRSSTLSSLASQRRSARR